MDLRMIITYVMIDAFCIILAISMSTHINRDCGSEFEVHTFRSALFSYCGFLIAGLLGLLSENHILPYIKTLIWVANIASLLLLVAACYYWFTFATARLHHCFPRTWVIFLARLPLALCVILCISSPLTGAIFTITPEGVYERGPLFVLLYLSISIYAILVPIQAIFIGIKEKQFEKKRQCFVIGMFFVFPCLAGIFQVYLANMPILAPSIVTSFFLVFINMQSLQIYNDALTGLNNRRRAYQYLDEQLSGASETKPITVFLMDVNAFKQINDQYGHGEGDNALKTIATALQRLCQHHPLFVARYGGDEFLMVQSWRFQTPAETIIADFHKILASLCTEKTLPYNISLSIGYAQGKNPNAPLDEVVNEADKALYHQKHLLHEKRLDPL